MVKLIVNIIVILLMLIIASLILCSLAGIYYIIWKYVILAIINIIELPYWLFIIIALYSIVLVKHNEPEFNDIKVYVYAIIYGIIWVISIAIILYVYNLNYYNEHIIHILEK